MDNILSWNVRVLNGLNKKEDISLVLMKHNAGLVGLLRWKLKSKHTILKKLQELFRNGTVTLMQSQKERTEYGLYGNQIDT